MQSAREQILSQLRHALNGERSPVLPLPETMRVRSRTPGTSDAELAQLLSVIGELGGKTRRIKSLPEFDQALAELVKDENITKATLWDAAELRELQVPETMERLGVQLVSGRADKLSLAACDLGITGVNAALAESGTLVLVSNPAQPPMVSLLPRVHLAILRPSALRVDLRELFAEFSHQEHIVLISGPSRTADIEKVLALGVHGPKSLYVWCLE